MTFASQGVYKVFAGNNMTLFVGTGHYVLMMVNESFAKGLMVVRRLLDC